VLASIGHAQQFASARRCSAWAGLVPKQNSTGGQVQLGSITKNGDCSLRVLLIHGARSVLRWADKHTHAQSRWIRDLVARRGKNKAVVALANKLMRIVWVVLTQGVEYDMRKAFRAQPA
jgi:transposase